MKKIKILIISFLVFASCGKDYRKFTITDFSKKRIDTLRPYGYKSYVSYYIKIKGHTNDSIKIFRKGYYDIILSGNIDTLINGDYYGTEKVIWVFDPYNATEGELEIEYGL